MPTTRLFFALTLTALIGTSVGPAFANAQTTVVLVNNMGHDAKTAKPNMLCSATSYNLKPGGAGWVTRDKPGKLHYTVHLNSASCDTPPTGYVGIGNIDGNGKVVGGYVFSGQLPDNVTVVAGVVAQAPCPAGADLCYIVNATAPLIIPTPQVYSQIPYRGVSLSGAEFASNPQFPQFKDIPYFIYKGMNTIRLPIKWEYLQPDINSNTLAADYNSQMMRFIKFATDHKIYVILDLHNYMRYGNTVVTAQQLANTWSLLANEFKDNPRVIFELMNEPHDMQTEQILANENAAIAAIRATGANNLILVSGNGWDGISDWTANWYGTPNTTVFTGVVDPANNYAIEVHSYYDSPSGGGGGGNSKTQCVPYWNMLKIESADLFVDWLRANHLRAFMSETGVNQQPSCYQDMDTILSFLETNSDVFIGWGAWTAGSAWPASYAFNLMPNADGSDRPQMIYGYGRHLTPTSLAK